MCSGPIIPTCSKPLSEVCCDFLSTCQVCDCFSWKNFFCKPYPVCLDNGWRVLYFILMAMSVVESFGFTIAGAIILNNYSFLDNSYYDVWNWCLGLTILSAITITWVLMSYCACQATFDIDHGFKYAECKSWTAFGYFVVLYLAKIAMLGWGIYIMSHSDTSYYSSGFPVLWTLFTTGFWYYVALSSMVAAWLLFACFILLGWLVGCNPNCCKCFCSMSYY